MKIIITGGAGFIGSNLTKKLLQENHQVIGIDNFSYGEKRNIAPFLNHPNYQFIEGDVKDQAVLDHLSGDVLVHFASQKIPRYSNALKTLDENYGMLKNVVAKCIKDNIKILFASTSDIYGKNTNLPFTEESDSVLGNPTVKRWAYALSKIYGEQYILANNDEHNLQYTIVRFFGSYGPNHNLTWWGGPQSVFIEKAFKQEAIEIHGDGLQTRTFTFIDDTVDALYRCITNPASTNEIFNIATNPTEEVTILDLAKIIWELVHGKEATPNLTFIPYSNFGRYEDVMRRLPCIDKIKDKLGFDPQVTLREGLQRTIEWQKNISN